MEQIEELIDKADSKTQQMMYMRVITRMRTLLDDLYDREYLQQINRDPSLIGKVYPKLSGTGRVKKTT
jgi:hypothetical protein